MERRAGGQRALVLAASVLEQPKRTVPDDVMCRRP